MMQRTDQTATGQGPPKDSGNEGEWRKRLPTAIRWPVIAGLAIVVFFFGGFGFWAATVPISGAAVTAGVVAASGLNQAVDHLEGGLISEILVREGDRVSNGAAMLLLDPTRVAAERDRVRNTLLSLRVREARLIAERDGLETLVFSAALESEAEMLGLEEDLLQQRKEFSNRLERFGSQIQVLDRRADAVREEMEGLRAQQRSEEIKLDVIKEELSQKADLLERGLTPRSQFNALKRQEADSQGRIGSLRATLAQRETALLEIDKQVSQLRATRREEAAAGVNETRLQLGELAEQLRAREDVLQRMVIRAPVDGVVVKLNKNTVGSVVRPGEVIAEILPTGSDLVIETRVAPQDIDVVRPGQLANVRFPALNTRTTPEVPARVSYVSADRLVDADTGASYFSARLELDGDLPEPLTRDQLYPGMPVEAFIRTGERTFLQYLVRPVTDSFNRAFREE